jgi:hypothetical protein
MKLKYLILLLCILTLLSYRCYIRKYDFGHSYKIFGEFVGEGELKDHYGLKIGEEYEDKRDNIFWDNQYSYIQKQVASCNQYCGYETEVRIKYIFADNTTETKYKSFTEFNKTGVKYPVEDEFKKSHINKENPIVVSTQTMIVNNRKCFVECITFDQKIKENFIGDFNQDRTQPYVRYFYVTIESSSKFDQNNCHEKTLVNFFQIDQQQCKVLRKDDDIFFRIVTTQAKYEYFLLTGRFTVNDEELARDEFKFIESYQKVKINIFNKAKGWETIRFTYDDYFRLNSFCYNALKAIANFHKLTNCNEEFIGFDSFENGEVNFAKKVGPLDIIEKTNPSYYRLEKRVNNLHVLRLYYLTYDNKQKPIKTEKKYYFNYSASPECPAKLEAEIGRYFLTDCKDELLIGYDSDNKGEVYSGKKVPLNISEMKPFSYRLEQRVNNLSVLRLYYKVYDDEKKPIKTEKKYYFNYSQSPECPARLEAELGNHFLTDCEKEKYMGYDSFEDGEVNFHINVNILDKIKTLNPTFYTFDQRVKYLQVLRFYYLNNNDEESKITVKKYYFNYSKNPDCPAKLKTEIGKHFLTDCKKVILGCDSFDDNKINFDQLINPLKIIQEYNPASYRFEQVEDNLQVLKLIYHDYDSILKRSIGTKVKKFYFTYPESECYKNFKIEIGRNFLTDCNKEFLGYETFNDGKVNFNQLINPLKIIQEYNLASYTFEKVKDNLHLLTLKYHDYDRILKKSIEPVKKFYFTYSDSECYTNFGIVIEKKISTYCKKEFLGYETFNDGKVNFNQPINPLDYIYSKSFDSYTLERGEYNLQVLKLKNVVNNQKPNIEKEKEFYFTYPKNSVCYTNLKTEIESYRSKECKEAFFGYDSFNHGGVNFGKMVDFLDIIKNNKPDFYAIDPRESDFHRLRLFYLTGEDSQKPIITMKALYFNNIKTPKCSAMLEAEIGKHISNCEKGYFGYNPLYSGQVNFEKPINLSEIIQKYKPYSYIFEEGIKNLPVLKLNYRTDDGNQQMMKLHFNYSENPECPAKLKTEIAKQFSTDCKEKFIGFKFENDNANFDQSISPLKYISSENFKSYSFEQGPDSQVLNLEYFNGHNQNSIAKGEKLYFMYSVNSECFTKLKTKIQSYYDSKDCKKEYFGYELFSNGEVNFDHPIALLGIINKEGNPKPAFYILEHGVNNLLILRLYYRHYDKFKNPTDNFLKFYFNYSKDSECLAKLKSEIVKHVLTCEQGFIGYDSFEDGKVNFDQPINSLDIIKEYKPTFYTLEEKNNLQVLKLNYLVQNKNKEPIEKEKFLYFAFEFLICSEKLKTKLRGYFLSDCEKEIFGYDSFEDGKVNFNKNVNLLDFIKKNPSSYLFEKGVNNLQVLKLVYPTFVYGEKDTEKSLYFTYSEDSQCYKNLNDKLKQLNYYNK